MAEENKAESKKRGVLRRQFLTTGSAAIAAGALGVRAGKSNVATVSPPAASVNAPPYARSAGFIVHDSRVCFGCQSCMYACSLVNEGEANPSLSRIQIIRDSPSFTKYPYDIVMSICRQCNTPLCVQNCPTGACHIDAAHGNVRRIDQEACIGCKTCINSCPQKPHRTIWNGKKNKSSKCDLCTNTLNGSRPGGPQGNPACVEICPAKALKLVAEVPTQRDIVGYDVNLAPPSRPRPKMFSPIPAKKE